MAISDVISVVKAANTRTPTAQGFGKSAFFTYHTLNSDLFREYRSIAAMVTDGFTTVSEGYLWAQAQFSQSPRPESVIIARAPAPAKTVTITITDSTQNNHIKLNVVSPDGTVTAIDYTILAAATTTTVATAVELLVEACPGIDSTSSGAVITITPTTATQVFAITANSLLGCTLADTTADPGYATALTTLRTTGTDDFYFVQTEINSPLAVAAMRAACETAGKLYFWQTSNSIELTVSGTLFFSQKALSANYGAGFFVHNEKEYATGAAAAVCGTRAPGSYSLNLKALVGVTPVSLTSTQSGFLDGDNANYYVLVANGIQGVQGTTGGSITSGGERIDIIHGTDWFIARCQERILQIQASQDKVDYTDEGVMLFISGLEAVGVQAERQRLLKAGKTVVSFDPTASQSPTDVGNRYYPGLKIASVYAGAIHKSKLELTLTLT